MHNHVRIDKCTGMFTIALALVAAAAHAQVTPPPAPGTPQAKVAAGTRYDAGAFRRFLLGDTYRDLWTTPITVPVLDLQSYAGGIEPYKIGGGKQTKSLRFKNAAGYEYVFRLVDKEHTNPPPGWENTVVDWIARDQVSSHHPAGAVVSDTLLTLAGVIHPSPMLAVMPDDPALGKFRKEFAGQLGFIEPYPNMPDSGSTGFAEAFQIIESESLLVLINTNSSERVDAHAYLTSRLVDMLVNDWDRHAGNYKWAKLSPDGLWVPITRDRDKVMQGYGGFVPWGGKVVQELVDFTDEYPHMSALTVHSRDMDRRFLADLGKAEFDSIGGFLKNAFSDEVLEAAIHRMPAEYRASWPETERKLKTRRDALPTETTNFYEYLKDDIDIHASDAPEHATVKLVDDNHVDVEIRGANAPQPYYCRRFHTAETREIRLYMHGGDDRVEVSGPGAPHMDIRIIGGDGANNITDTSRIAPHSDEVKIYDHGRVSGTRYGPLEEKKPKKVEDQDKKDDEDEGKDVGEKKDADEDDVDPDFDRRPWYEHAYRVRDLPRDYGANSTPVGSIKAPGDLGLVLGFGLQKTRWGFRKWPYSSKMKILGEYSTKVGGWRATAFGDKRMENQELHFMATARMSELEILNFYGYGNHTPGGPEQLFEVQQRQWELYPVIAYQVGTRSDFMLGPVARYSTTNDIQGTFATAEQPYGYGDFAQGGVRLALLSDSRDHSRAPGRKILLDLSASWYPALFDVTEPFGALSAITATYITIPFLPLDPILALKAGGRMLIGDVFPFHDAAFIGGRPSERDLPRERYAGDQSVYGTAELRIPVVQFALLLPWDFGVYVWGDAGRVYLDGDSPGGWHEAAGAGMWLGILSPATTLSLEGDSAADVLRLRLGLSF